MRPQRQRSRHQQAAQEAEGLGTRLCVWDPGLGRGLAPREVAVLHLPVGRRQGRGEARARHGAPHRRDGPSPHLPSGCPAWKDPAASFWSLVTQAGDRWGSPAPTLCPRAHVQADLVWEPARPSWGQRPPSAGATPPANSAPRRSRQGPRASGQSSQGHHVWRLLLVTPSLGDGNAPPQPDCPFLSACCVLGTEEAERDAVCIEDRRGNAGRAHSRCS